MNRRDFLRTVGSVAAAGTMIGSTRPFAQAAAQAGASSGTGFPLGVWTSIYNRYSESPEATHQRLERLAQGGIDLLVPLVEIGGGRAGVMWHSELVPVCYKCPEDWDPVEVFVNVAHELGMEVHPWLCCFNGKVMRYLREQHPETTAIFSESENWAWAARHKNYACAMQPRVQKFLFDAYRELGERYGPDGFHMDYIRTGSQCTCDYCTAEMAKLGLDIRAMQARYDQDRDFWLNAGTHGLMRKYGVRKVVGSDEEIDPVVVDEELDRWLGWRIDRLTHFISQLHQYAHKHDQVTSAAVKFFWPRQCPTGAQDWVRWARENIVDYMMSMNYTADPQFVARLASEQTQLIAGSKCQYWPGLGRTAEKWTTTPEALVEQIEIARNGGAHGAMIFNESGLTDDDLALLKDV